MNVNESEHETNRIKIHLNATKQTQKQKVAHMPPINRVDVKIEQTVEPIHTVVSAFFFDSNNNNSKTNNSHRYSREWNTSYARTGQLLFTYLQNWNNVIPTGTNCTLDMRLVKNVYDMTF